MSHKRHVWLVGRQLGPPYPLRPGRRGRRRRLRPQRSSHARLHAVKLLIRDAEFSARLAASSAVAEVQMARRTRSPTCHRCQVRNGMACERMRHRACPNRGVAATGSAPVQATGERIASEDEAFKPRQPRAHQPQASPGCAAAGKGRRARVRTAFRDVPAPESGPAQPAHRMIVRPLAPGASTAAPFWPLARARPHDTRAQDGHP